MSSSGLDAYEVVTARPPEPEEPPDPQAVARAERQALFTQEHQIRVWEAPLNSRGSRQRSPVAPEETGEMEAQAVEQQAMCILHPDGSHKARGLHCPHNLRADGDPDEIVATVRF